MRQATVIGSLTLLTTLLNAIPPVHDAIEKIWSLVDPHKPTGKHRTPSSRWIIPGHEHEADPCELAKPAETPLEKFGDAILDAHYGNFTRCDVIIDAFSGTKPIDVEFDLEKSGEPAPSPSATDSLPIRQSPAGHRECHRTVFLNKPYIAEISAKVDLPGQRADLCQIADAATKAAVTRLKNGQPLINRTFPRSSLANSNACMLLNPSVLDNVGVDAVAPEPGFGEWDCKWNTDRGRSVDLRFDQNDPLSAPGSGKPVQFGSRTAFVQPDGDGGGNNCLVQIQYRSFHSEDDGEQKVELIRLTLRGPKPAVPSASLCAPAKTLAADAVTRLPDS